MSIDLEEGVDGASVLYQVLFYFISLNQVQKSTWILLIVYLWIDL
jgi:hypothetical protein